jgi:HPt (histidine-containing phosphotransfer) domain-containing protein
MIPMSDIFDRDGLLDRVDNDMEFLAETVEMLEEDGPELLGQIRDAIQAGDQEALSIAAHTYKGMVANFCADSTVEAALKLEVMGKDGDLAGAPEALAVLEDLARRLATALQELVQGDGA